MNYQRKRPVVTALLATLLLLGACDQRPERARLTAASPIPTTVSPSTSTSSSTSTTSASTTTVPPTTTTAAPVALPTTTVRARPPAVPVRPSAAQGTAGDARCQFAALIRSIWQRSAANAIRWAIRESRCTAGAANTRESCATSMIVNGQRVHVVSHALGVFQLCMPLHSWLYAEAGCSNVYDAACNVRMAWLLFLAQPSAWS